jgi:uncharacterized protein YndB with AHSA1/START domain
MNLSKATSSTDGRDLIVTRIISAPPAKVFQAWTEPTLLTQWFTPAPWTTPTAETDVRPGGSTLIVMRSPEGIDHLNRGVYLEVVPNRRLVFTNAYTSAWEPAEKPFMTVILTFDPTPAGSTQYAALVRHWTIADREAHEKMGFHQGWSIATEQLAALVENR